MNDPAPLAVSQILLPVSDLSASLCFYEEVLGLPLGFRDGDRYATVVAGPIKIALAAQQERAAADGPATAFKVPSVAEVRQRLEAGGGEVPQVAEGGHELTLEIVDPDRNSVIFYQPRPR